MDVETCVVCHEKIYGNVIRHHISYFPEKIVYVDNSCHAKIHLQKQYPHLAPSEGHAKIFYDEIKAERKREKLERQEEKRIEDEMKVIQKQAQRLDRMYEHRYNREYVSHYNDKSYKGYF